MYRYAVLLLTAFFCGALAATEQVVPLPDGRIVGGSDAYINQFPHQISMRYNGRHRCGGSIISENIILSAAHCVEGLPNSENLGIVAGNTRLSDKSVEMKVLRFIIHEGYNSNNQDFDVALLVLQGFFNFNANVQPIKLATQRPPAGTEVTVTGWGTLESGGSIPDHLQKVNVDIFDNSVCKRKYLFLFSVTNQMICAGVPEGGKDACQGDSGGPLIYKGEQLGIVSWGIGCASPNFPGVYASVPELHDWIVKTAKNNSVGWA